MKEVLVVDFFLMGYGLLSIGAAFLNWEWFLQKQKKAGFIRMLDKNASRVFNFMLGTLSLLVGAFDYFFPLFK